MKVVILTISDTRSKENDFSGQKIFQELEKNSHQIVGYEIVVDDKPLIKEKLIDYSDNHKVDFIVTTGGTGVGSRDTTPEATLEILDKKVPGINEYLRIQGVSRTKKSVLSRGVSGIRKKTLIVNLPGSLNAVTDAMPFLLEIAPHTIDMIFGAGH